MPEETKEVKETEEKDFTRKDIVTLISEQARIPKQKAEVILNAVFDFGIVKQLEEGKTVSISGFGKFLPVERAARVGRNPQTGEELQIEEKTAIRFKPSSKLKSKIN